MNIVLFAVKTFLQLENGFYIIIIIICNHIFSVKDGRPIEGHRIRTFFVAVFCFSSNCAIYLQQNVFKVVLGSLCLFLHPALIINDFQSASLTPSFYVSFCTLFWWFSWQDLYKYMLRSSNSPSKAVNHHWKTNFFRFVLLHRTSEPTLTIPSCFAALKGE